MKVTKRPNPAVAQAERLARNAEEMTTNAEKDAGEHPNVTRSVRALADRRRNTAARVKQAHPNLYASEK